MQVEWHECSDDISFPSEPGWVVCRDKQESWEGGCTYNYYAVYWAGKYTWSNAGADNEWCEPVFPDTDEGFRQAEVYARQLANSCPSPTGDKTDGIT